VSTLFLNRAPINVDIEPTSFAAHSLNPLGGKVGKLTLEIDCEGFRLINKKGRTVSTVPWFELEELKNEVREKGRFSYRGTIDNGLNQVRALMRVGLEDSAEQERLAAIFDQLPQEVFGRKCPDCGGIVVDNVCQNCGQTFTGQQRRKGLRMVLIGTILLVLGIILTYTTFDSSSGTMWLFYGPMLIGAGLIIGGLIGLIFGARV
jgi:hypothetical protein